MVDKLLALIGDRIVNPLILLMGSAALVLFLWGVFEFIRDSESEDGRKKGAQHMLWGIIGLFIMVSAVALIRVALNSFGIPIPSSF